MKNFLILTVAMIVTGCATTEYRTKFSDKNMRIMVDPAGMSPDVYAKVQYAVMKTDKWSVLDRSNAFEAIKREQEELHRTATERYEDQEKWAQWGKLYGVGAVVVAHQQCHHTSQFWRGRANKCQQFLNIVDANTGVVIVAVADEAYADPTEWPSWDNIAEMLADAYPEKFEKSKETERLEMYKLESKEAAQRQKETVVNRKIKQSDEE
jgi:hypothetical protein